MKRKLTKLEENLQHAMKLNQLFIDLNFKGKKDLNVISTYLAFNIHLDLLSLEDISKMLTLICQLKDTFDEIRDSKDKN